MKLRVPNRKGRYWYLMEGFLSTETLEASVWIKNLWFSCQECEQFQSYCQLHQERGGGTCTSVHLRVCTCMCMCVWDYRKFTECKTEIYMVKPPQSIISYITALTYQIAICRPSAVRPMCCLSVLSYILGVCWVNIWLGLGQFQICKEKKQMPKLPLERGGERRKAEKG